MSSHGAARPVRMYEKFNVPEAWVSTGSRMFLLGIWRIFVQTILKKGVGNVTHAQHYP